MIKIVWIPYSCNDQFSADHHSIGLLDDDSVDGHSEDYVYDSVLEHYKDHSEDHYKDHLEDHSDYDLISDLIYDLDDGSYDNSDENSIISGPLSISEPGSF